MFTVRSRNAEQTEHIGEATAKALPCGSLIAMYGDLGAGKTVFVKGIACGLGLTSVITSPTFNIVREYEDKLAHFDVYRIDDPEEMYEIGFFEYLESDVLKVIEWAEKIEELLPDERLDIRIEYAGDDRLITFDGPLSKQLKGSLD